MLYAVVDIETTGGYAASNGITEIAVFITDGKEIVDSFHTLLNPGYAIPRFIESLTGITDEMVVDARTFPEIAPDLFELLHDKVFVAHNVNFDYSFIRYQFEQCGYHLNCKKLCTIRLGRKIIPGLRGYGLGKLCAHLDIKIAERHRAAGDAAATVVLLHLLLNKDKEDIVQNMLKKNSKEQSLPPNVSPECVRGLPDTPGVYFFKDKKGKVIYVGKAKNIRKRVSSHFSNNKPGKQKQELLKSIYNVSFQRTGTELMAFILENIEIQQRWPRLNRSMKKFVPSYGLYVYTDLKGYLKLFIEKKKKILKPVLTFENLTLALSSLRQLVKEYELCPRFSFLTGAGVDCQGNHYFHCHGACEGKELPEVYNKRVEKCLQDLEKGLPSFAVVDEGLSEDNLSCIVVEDGRFWGMGYVSSLSGIDEELDFLKERLKPYPDNEYIRGLVFNFVRQHPERVRYFM